MEKKFAYKFNEGPLKSEEKLAGNWDVGNCRRAVQYYIWKNRKTFLKPEQVLCPAGYYETGSFIVTDSRDFTFNALKEGDVVYAEAIRDKHGGQINKSEKAFTAKDKYIISPHTAIFTGKNGGEIWHATAVEGKSCFWSKEKFLKYYHPVAAKRISDFFQAHTTIQDFSGEKERGYP